MTDIFQGDDGVSPAHLRRRGLGGRPTVAKQKIKGGWGASPAAALLLTALAEAVRAVLNIDYTESAELGAVWAQKKTAPQTSPQS